VWGRGSFSGPSGSQVATVNGQPITLAEFNREYKTVEDELRRKLGDNFNKLVKPNDIKRIALQRLVQRALLIELAKEEGLKVSDWAVAKAIEEMPIFQENGKFSVKLYKAFLRAQGLTPQAFEETVRKDLLVQKVLTVVNHAPSVTQAELTELYKKSFGQRKIGYKVFTADQFNPKVSEEEVEQFYKKHKEQFTKEAGEEVYLLSFENTPQGKERAKEAYELAKKGELEKLKAFNPKPAPEKLAKELQKRPFIFRSENGRLILAFKLKKSETVPLEKVKAQIEEQLKEEKALELALKAAKSFNGTLQSGNFTPQTFVQTFKPLDVQQVDRLFVSTPAGRRVIMPLEKGYGVFEPEGPLTAGKIDENKLNAVKLLVLNAKAQSDLNYLLTLLEQKASVKVNPQLFKSGE